MWSRRRRPTLAAQFLLLQLAVLVLVVLVAGVVSVRQADVSFSETRRNRLRATAEALASTSAVRDTMELAGDRQVLASYAQDRADLVGATAVLVLDTDARVVVGTDPLRQGDVLDLNPGVLEGRAWSGDVDDAGDRAVAAQVPILSDNGPDEAAAGLPRPARSSGSWSSPRTTRR